MMKTQTDKPSSVPSQEEPPFLAEKGTSKKVYSSQEKAFFAKNLPLAWVTGASTGIGRALTLLLATQGWRVIASARRESLLEELALQNENIFPFPLDVRDSYACEKTIETIEELMGLPSLSVFCAGASNEGQGFQSPLEDAKHLMTLNFLGTLNCFHALLPRLQENHPAYKKHAPLSVSSNARPPQVAFVSSIAGYKGLPFASAYCSSKAALTSYAESFYPILQKEGIKLQVINPGFVRTPLTDKNTFPMPLMISAEKAAQKIYTGLQKPAFEISFPKRMVWATKLISKLPYPLFFSVSKQLMKRRETSASVPKT